ncbi:Versicolorin B synthase [Lachnellula suecica]|uniref:Versicolorin B synthase n=1 Tax=Lachnellula suecica TaxID=602035 RepID=A0A8T9CDF4_9HELO|nr:Versicolorin B synthase [Lachnellula suecica]
MLFSSLALCGTLLAPITTASVIREQSRRDTDTTTTSSYQESLSAQSLIGSHFGVPGFPKTFDYIIVGGGTAGNTLARRLAANSKFSVALIEAGGFYETDNGNLTDIPADAIYWIDSEPTIRNNLIDWYQFTTPQAGWGGRSVHYPSGKTLGGDSARNFLWYMRSSAGAYQKWADAVGDTAYTFANLLPYFKKSVSFNPPVNSARPANASALTDTTQFSSTGGPLQVSYPYWANAISSWFQASLQTLGLKAVKGFTDGNILGYAYISQTSTTDSVRSTSESSFLREAFLQTNNLYVYKSTTATKILFSGTKAIGVTVNTAGQAYTLSANKEVISSAGAFRSPQLLMVSGIGPAATLSANKITPVKTLAGVGQNMWDHIAFGPAYAVDLTTHSQVSTNPTFDAAQVNLYNNARQGILTNVGGDFVAFEKLPAGAVSSSTRTALDSAYGSDWPDVELLPFDLDLVSLTTDGRNYVSSLCVLVAPFSRGNVTLNGTDTAVNPIVNPNWLGDARDQEVAIAGFKQARAVFATTAIKKIINGPEFSPGAAVTSDAAILAVIEASATSISHAAGTCKMGKSTDSLAVVDNHAKVFGVTGLRVVDASTFPLLPPGHPQGTVYALAEKIAADILAGN